ncbi:ABC transporter ATP-binding protein [bacterium]|nr:ABC transporter ATP-binding protein [bacterium]
MTVPSQHASSIHCESLTVRYPGDFLALTDVSLEIPSGEILSLVGPSGCGKTTLLRLIAGLESPTAGSVVAQPAIRGELGEIAFVFQQPTLLSWRSALQNVALPLELLAKQPMARPLGRRERLQTAERALVSVGLKDAMHKYPRQLSGGMKMRVSIARALVTNPRVLLLDEPFAALDEMLRDQLGEMLLELWREQRFTAVMVTHNVSESVLLSHRIAILDGGQLKETFENPLSWPRGEMMRATTEFGEFYRHVSSTLRKV